MTLKTFKILRLLLKGRSDCPFSWKKKKCLPLFIEVYIFGLSEIFLFCVARLFNPDWSKAVTVYFDEVLHCLSCDLCDTSTLLFPLWTISMKRLLKVYRYCCACHFIYLQHYFRKLTTGIHHETFDQVLPLRGLNPSDLLLSRWYRIWRQSQWLSRLLLT